MNYSNQDMVTSLDIHHSKGIVQIDGSMSPIEINRESAFNYSINLCAKKAGHTKLKLKCMSSTDNESQALDSVNIDVIVADNMESVIKETTHLLDSLILKAWNIKKPKIKLIIDNINDKMPTRNGPTCAPDKATIPLVKNHGVDAKSVIGYLIRSYIHEIYGHGYLFKSTSYGRLLSKLWKKRNQSDFNSSIYLTIRDCCIATMEGFATWLFLASSEILQAMIPAFSIEIQAQLELLKMQLYLNRDPTQRVNQSDVFKCDPWNFDFSLNITPESINPYSYGFLWIQRISHQFGSLLIPQIIKQIMSISDFKLSLNNPKRFINKIENRPDYRLYKVAFAEQIINNIDYYKFRRDERYQGNVLSQIFNWRL